MLASIFGMSIVSIIVIVAVGAWLDSRFGDKED